MAAAAYDLWLEPDQFAFYFRTNSGVDAADLGRFLQRTATVVKRKGISLNVVATHEGSLAVVLQAAKGELKKHRLRPQG